MYIIFAYMEKVKQLLKGVGIKDADTFHIRSNRFNWIFEFGEPRFSIAIDSAGTEISIYSVFKSSYHTYFSKSIRFNPLDWAQLRKLKSTY